MLPAPARPGTGSARMSARASAAGDVNRQPGEFCTRCGVHGRNQATRLPNRPSDLSAACIRLVRTRLTFSIVGGLSCLQARAKVPCVSSDGSEMAMTADAVAQKWQQTRTWFEQLPLDPFHVMTDIIDAAHAVPVLRQLFLDRRLFTLCFSACAAHHCSDDLPVIEAREHNLSGDRSLGPGYIVRNPLGGDVIGEADDADSAITLLLAQLPADVAPATGACRHVWDRRRPGWRSPESSV